MKFELKSRVKYYDIEKSGVMHNTRYFFLLEDARTEIVRSIGYNYAEIEKEGILLPLTQNHINYKLPAKYDDILIIKVWVKKIKNFSIKFGYEIYREEVLIADGYTEHVCLDPKTAELTEVPEKLKDALKEYME